MQELKYNIKYLYHKKELYLSVLLLLSISLLHVFLSIQYCLSLNQVYEEFYSGEYQFILYNVNVNFQGLIMLLIPIICSMILSDASFIENKLRISNILYLRINQNKNIIIRLILCIVLTFIICFLSFMFNYIILAIIFGSGNFATFNQDVSFHLGYLSDFFLDNIRINNAVLFVLLINVCVSFIYGLLSGLSYSISLYLKNRIVIYFVPLLFLIITELLFSMIKSFNISFMTVLQPFSKLNLSTYFICVFILIFIILFLIIIKIRKKDILI